MFEALESVEARKRPKPEEVTVKTILDRYARFWILQRKTPEVAAN
jgi:hypothetical protein